MIQFLLFKSQEISRNITGTFKSMNHKCFHEVETFPHCDPYFHIFLEISCLFNSKSYAFFILINDICTSLYSFSMLFKIYPNTYLTLIRLFVSLRAFSLKSPSLVEYLKAEKQEQYRIRSGTALIKRHYKLHFNL